MITLNRKLIGCVNLKFVPLWPRALDHQQMVEHVGTRLKRALKAAEKTQAWLAEELGVSNNAVSKWIRSGEIRRENAIKAAEKLSISIGDLLTGFGQTTLSQEAIEVARAWLKLKEGRREAWREGLFLEAAVSSLYPWLKVGKPESDGYEAWERQVERDMRERLGRLPAFGTPADTPPAKKR